MPFLFHSLCLFLYLSFSSSFFHSFFHVLCKCVCAFFLCTHIRNLTSQFVLQLLRMNQIYIVQLACATYIHSIHMYIYTCCACTYVHICIPTYNCCVYIIYLYKIWNFVAYTSNLLFCSSFSCSSFNWHVHCFVLSHLLLNISLITYTCVWIGYISI